MSEKSDEIATKKRKLPDLTEPCPPETGEYLRARKPDQQAFDEVVIRTVPRYKESSLFGSEWHISAITELRYNGSVLFQATYHNVEGAIRDLQSFATGVTTKAHESDLCDQEGCSEPSDVVYKLKKTFCDMGNPHDPYELCKTPMVRKFCKGHSRRGDCGLQDADDNYEILPNLDDIGSEE